MRKRLGPRQQEQLPRAKAGQSQDQIVRLDRLSTSVDDDHPELHRHSPRFGRSAMMTAAPLYRLWCGLDVAAKTFTATWTTDRTHYVAPVTLPQTAAGIATLYQHLQATGIPAAETLIVLEATGSYWIGLAVQFHAAGFVVSVVK